MTLLGTIGERLTKALVGCVLVAGLLAAPAGASFGEISHFGEAGTGKGQFNLGEAFGATDAIGVDQTTNAVYVVDGPTKKEYRIQKFELQSGKWTAVAERKFKPAFPRVSGIEGVAVDHARNRLYVLVLEERGEGTSVDPEVEAAGSLYAFTASGLEPASGTTGEGVLDEPTALNTLSDVAGQALLEPSGIAVDPTTGDVIVLAYEDPVGEDEELRVVLERIGSTGTVGTRWVDTSDFFGAGGEVTPEVTSPVVSSAGKVYVAGGELPAAGLELAEEIDEVPSDFSSTAPPTPISEFNSEGLVTFPGIPSPLHGAGLTLGSDGTFYAFAQLLRQEGAGFHEPAVLAFSPTGAEIGWFGGQSQPLEGGHVACAISFRGHPVIAAGADGTVFAFDNAPSSPDVVEFGSSGSGCPTATATAPTVTINNEAVSGAVSPGANVKFASTLTQANALAVEWEFTNKATNATEHAVGPANEFQAPEITHAFTLAGEYAVKEIIHTDDLASPTLTEETTVDVKASAPTAQFNLQTPVAVGEAASFDAKTSAGNGEPITSYTWNFGDGTAPVLTTTPATSHAYGAPGTYTVTLVVKTVIGTGEATHQIEVVTPGGGPTPPGVTVTAPTTNTGGGGATNAVGGGVLSYKASIAGSSLSVGRGGAVVIKIACQGQSKCSGTVTLRTLSAIATRSSKHKAILTLASGSFSTAGGTSKSLTLHLSAAAQALLKRLHVLKARATIAARDSSGKSHTSSAVVSLRAAKAHSKH